MTLRVSNSEALSVGTCEAKWMYAFHPKYKLEPNYQSTALMRGLIGHEALEKFFKHLLNFANGNYTGEVLEKAKESATSFLIEEIVTASKSEDFSRVDVITELVPIITEYFKSSTLSKFLDKIEILGVEVGFEVQVAPDYMLPGRIDLLVRYKKGQWAGEIVPVDNKFVYNFWSEDDFRMNSQMPTYIYALRQLYPNDVIKRSVINQLRHRVNATERFAMTPVESTKIEVTNVIANHLRFMGRIDNLKSDSDPDSLVTRSLSKYTCGNCGFKLLCKSDLNERNSKDLIKMEYRPNTYGYNGEDE